MESLESYIVASMERHLDAFCDELRELVEIDTPSDDPLAVGQLMDLIGPRLAQIGAEVSRPAPDILRAALGPSEAREVLLLLHADTVFGRGEAQRRPPRSAGGRAYGPGVADMKGGIALMLWVLRLLVERAALGARIKVLVTGDEETGAERSRDVIARESVGVSAALVLEPGRESGAIVSARKAVGSFRLLASGIEAHAGVEPWRGASAVHELARRVAAIAELSGRIEGVHYNVGRIDGGTRANVVAGEASCLIDLRVPREVDMAPAQEFLERAALQAADARVRLELTGGFSGPPMEKTGRTEVLLQYAREAARQVGFELQDVATGGGSDGNRIAAAGVPVLDGLGPVGGRAHSDEEFLELSSVPQRAGVLAGILARIAAAGRD